MELIEATKLNDVDKIKLILETRINSESEFDIDFKDQDGNTALLWASYNGFYEAARLLLESGSNVNTEDSDKSNSLMFASYHGYFEIVELLLEHLQE